MKNKNEVHARLVAYIKANPTVTYTAIARTLGITVGAVSAIAVKAGISRMNGRAKLSMDDLNKLDCTFGDITLMDATRVVEVSAHEMSLIKCGLLGGVADPLTAVDDAQHERAADAIEEADPAKLDVEAATVKTKLIAEAFRAEGRDVTINEDGLGFELDGNKYAYTHHDTDDWGV
jgi:hypothetical protein